MTDPTVESILDELAARGAQVLNLLNHHRAEEFRRLWGQDARLYRGFGKKLVSEGRPAPALEVVTRGLLAHPGDPDLLYLRALALARGGNVTRAEQFVKDLL